MPEIGTSGSMSGDGKRSVGHRPQATAPILDSTTSADFGGAPSRQLSELLRASRKQASDTIGAHSFDRLVGGEADRCWDQLVERLRSALTLPDAALRWLSRACPSW